MIICGTKEQAKAELVKIHNLLCNDLGCSEWEEVQEDGAERLFANCEVDSRNIWTKDYIFLEPEAVHYDNFTDDNHNVYENVWVITLRAGANYN